MSERILPTAWSLVRLDDVAELGAGNPAPQGDDSFSSDGVPFVRVKDMGQLGHQSRLSTSTDRVSVVGAKGLRLVPAGTLLFTKSGASTLLNQRAILAIDAYVVSHIGLAEPSKATCSEWLFYWLKTVDFAAIAHGGNMPSLPLSKVKALELPLPPLAEQKRIVAKIEELFSELEAGEESLRVARRQLGVYRQSLLKQAFEGQLTAKWRTQNPPNSNPPAALPETEDPHALPGDWRWIKLGSAIEEPAYGTSKKCSYESGGLGVLRIPNVVNGAIEADDLKFADFTKDERKSYELRAGDLLLIRSNGSVSIVGRCAIVEPKHTEFLYAGYLIRLRPRDALLDSRFLLSQLASHRLRSQIESSAKSTSGVNNINSKEIQRLVIALPSLPEQQEIVRVLDEQFEGIERNEREIDGALRSSAALRQAILQKAFTGRLVPQDPSDEPASTLLARLRAERAATPDKLAKRTQPRLASGPKI